MPILDVALAFALTMLAVAIAVTQMVRLLQLAAKMRRDVMQQMLEEYFCNKFEPLLRLELAVVQKTVSNDMEAELRKIATASGVAKSPWKEVLFHAGQLETLTELSTEEFVKRLRASKFGQKLSSELTDRADAVFAELGRGYEVVGEKFTRSFQVKSRWWASTVALVLALVFNVDAVGIMHSYLNGEVPRQTAIAQLDAIANMYERLSVSLLKDREPKATPEQFKEDFAAAKAQLGIVTSGGLPIGWSRFPYCSLGETGAVDCSHRKEPVCWAVWGFGILLTSALAGLGAPFWFDLVRGITRATERASRTNQAAR